MAVAVDSTFEFEIEIEKDPKSKKKEPKVTESVSAPVSSPKESKSSKEDHELRVLDYTSLKIVEKETIASTKVALIRLIEAVHPDTNEMTPFVLKQFFKLYDRDQAENEIDACIKLGTAEIGGLCRIIAIVHSNPHGYSYSQKATTDQSPERHKNSLDTLEKYKIKPEGISLMFEYYNAFSLQDHLITFQNFRPVPNAVLGEWYKNKFSRFLQPTCKQASLWFERLFKGLSKLHAKKIIHGDIAARNILFDIRSGLNSKHLDLLNEEDISIKLIDFGMAFSSDLNESERQSHIFIRKEFQRFEAPELVSAPRFQPFKLRALPISTKSDVYALGFVFAELLTGKFYEYALDNNSHFQMDQIYLDLLNLRSKYEVLVEIIINCLNKDPKERLEAQEIVDILENTKKEKPVLMLAQYKISKQADETAKRIAARVDRETRAIMLDKLDATNDKCLVC